MSRIKKILSAAVICVLCAAVFSACGKEEEPQPTSSASFIIESQEPMATPTPMPTPTTVPTPAPTPTPSESALPSQEAVPEGGQEEGASVEPAADANPDVLEEKDENAEVTKVQERLEELGYLDKVTGYYGTDTKAAVEAFQKNNDLDVDGRVGPATMEALMADDAKKAS